MNEAEAAMAGFTLVDVLKFGAIGISLICLTLAFWTNQSLARRADSMAPATLASLLSHARWTMKYSFVCLIAAIVIESISRYRAPVTFKLAVLPLQLQSDFRRVRSLDPEAVPFSIEVAAGDEPIQMKNGSGNVVVNPNELLVVNLDGMWAALKDLDGRIHGEALKEKGLAGTLEPIP